MAVILDMSETDYHALDAISASQLKLLHSKSPAHWYHEYALGNSKDKDCYAEGRAIHCALLEPEKFKHDYQTLPDYASNSWDGMQPIFDFYNVKREDFAKLADAKEYVQHQKDNADFEIISQSQMDMITGIRDGFAKHPHIVDMMAGAKTEITLTWEREGVPCKARIDLVGKDYIGELKSTTDASLKGFERQAFNLGYHISAAWYREGLNENGLSDLRDLPFKFFVAEKDAPNAVGVYELDRESLHVGLLQADNAFARLALCKQNNHYPDYGAHEQIISVPQYIKNHFLGE